MRSYIDDDDDDDDVDVDDDGVLYYCISSLSHICTTNSYDVIFSCRLLKKLLSAGHRVVIFSQFTRTLDIVEDFLNLRGLGYFRLDGQTHRVMREVSYLSPSHILNFSYHHVVSTSTILILSYHHSVIFRIAIL